MKTPFTADQFFDVFKNYNETVYPIQIILFVLGLFTIFYAIRPVSNSNTIISLSLGFLWIWMGIVYHYMFFAVINKAAYAFSVIFVLQGILFLFMGIFQNKLSFIFRNSIYGYSGLIMIIYAMVIYPVIGYFLGHTYPYSPNFGLPCPTTIFTFGMLLWMDRKCSVILWIIPFIWLVIGFFAALNFGMWEDTGLMIAGLIAIPMILIKNKSF